MGHVTQPESIAKKTVLYTMPGVEAVRVRRDLPYHSDDRAVLTMDLYAPPGAETESPRPVLLFPTGFPDAGAERILGCRFKDMGAYVSWARLAAASGLAAITYANREPEADLHALLRYVRENAPELGIAGDRIGIWACSGHGPMALSLLMQNSGGLACAVLCYPYTLDLDGATAVAEAAKAFGFVNPCAGKSTADLRPDIPLFIARAGRDRTPRLNESLDRFLAEALTRNLPVTFSNHPDGPHAFDLFHESPMTREIIERILAFLRSNLLRLGRGGPMRRMAGVGILAALLGSSGCASVSRPDDARAEILRLDADWSAAAAEGRDVDRVVSYWSEDAMVLPPGSPPLVGRQAIRDYVAKSLQIPGFNISWKTTDVVVAGSGDLAYSTGTNRVAFTGPDGKPVVINGKAVAVWRKGEDGVWRCVVDIWNDTPSPPQ